MRYAVIGVGEVLWDLLPGGRQLGGAPANFACHAATLGAEAAVISRVGDDALGREALARLASRGLNLAGCPTDEELPTGTVQVDVRPDGHPEFQITPNVAWDALRAEDSNLRLVSGADAVCFGSLGQRTPAAAEAIRRLVCAARPGALRVLDINLRHPFYNREVVVQSLEIAHVLKLNETELPVLADWFALQGSPEEQLESLARRHHLQAVAFTLGARGSRLFCAGRWWEEPARAVVVKDAVGAGDAYTAALVAGLLRGWGAREILAAATDIAAFVCTQPGATPLLPATLTRPFTGV